MEQNSWVIIQPSSSLIKTALKRNFINKTILIYYFSAHKRLIIFLLLLTRTLTQGSHGQAPPTIPQTPPPASQGPPTNRTGPAQILPPHASWSFPPSGFVDLTHIGISPARHASPWGTREFFRVSVATGSAPLAVRCRVTERLGATGG